MFHLDNTSGVPEMPEVKEPQSNTPRWFGESESQGGISWPGADWFNIVQAELLSILEMAGETPDKTKLDQIASSIKSVSDSFRIDVAKPDGLKLTGYREHTAYDVLSRLQTLSDRGKTLSMLGYDPDVDPQIFADQEALGDTKLMLNGHISLAKKFRSIRRGSCVFSVRGGRQSTQVNNTGHFSPQVTGVTNAMQLRNYGTVDGVSVYVDATMPPFEEWEDISSASYTANTVTFSPEDMDSYYLVEIGDILRTKHSPYCEAFVIGKSDGVIMVDMWADSGTSTTVPTNGVGLYINPLDKGWPLNGNLIIPAGTRGKTGTVAELAIQNNGIANPTSLNGIDMVVLNAAYGGTAAYYARSAKTGIGWLYGFLAAGSRFNFYSRSGALTPYAGFIDRSNAVCGLKFTGNNEYSVLWSTSSDDTAIGYSTSPAIIDPIGRVLRLPYRTVSITESATLLVAAPEYIINTPGVTLTMPAIANHIAGHKYKLYFPKAGTYYIKAMNDETAVNGSSNYPLTTDTAWQTRDIQFDGSFWHVYN